MRFVDALFLLCLLGVLIILFISNLNALYVTGRVAKIRFLRSSVLIKLEGVKEDLIVFDNFVDLSKGDLIKARVKNLKRGESYVVQSIWKY